MKIENLKYSIYRFGLLAMFALGLIVSSAVAAEAQRRGRDRNDDRRPDIYQRDDDRGRRDDDEDYRGGGYYGDPDDRYNGRDRRGNQSLRFAYERGYRDGFKDGKKAAKTPRPER